MFIKTLKIAYLFFILTVYINRAKASKCGNFLCDEKSECKFNADKKELQCVCYKGYAEKVQDNYVYCNQPDIIDDNIKCLKEDETCGPYHKCNVDLVCEEINENSVELFDPEFKEIFCNPKEQKCLDKCCAENEVCQDDKKCEVRELPSHFEEDPFECPAIQKCGNKCCTLNESCSKENNCVAIEILEIPVEAKGLQCDQKCPDYCCDTNEICLNGTKCISKQNETVECLEFQICQNKCCTLEEICHNGNECVAKQSIVRECLQENLCLDKCCAEHEKCVNENICVPQIALTECIEIQKCQDKCCGSNEKCENGICILSEKNLLDCPDSLKCHDKCCTENQKCNSDRKCVLPEDLECSGAQKCLNKCCSPTQICNKENKCEDPITAYTTTFLPYTTSKDFLNCPQHLQCQDKCCTEQEKCSSAQECLPLNTIECLDTELCGNKCCAVNETCNDYNECVAFLEVSTLENCPEKQKCLNNCCLPLEICTDLKQCVKKTVDEMSNLYDFEKEIAAPKKEIENKFDAIVPLYDWNAILPKIKCPKDYYLCQDKCCNFQQTCNEMGDCIDQVSQRNCVLGQNCTENVNTTEFFNDTECISAKNCFINAHVVGKNNSVAYTLIGLGGLVLVLCFALFKIYVFRRTRRNTF